MSRRTALTTPLLFVLLFAASCNAFPTAPAPEAGLDAFADTRSDLIVAPLLVVVVPGQVVSLERFRGVVETAFIQAHVVGWGGTGSMLGGIRVVVGDWDGDLTPPRSDPDAQALQVRIERGTFTADGAIDWEGTGTLRGPRGEASNFPIAGSFRPVPEKTDELILEILRSDVYDGARAAVKAGYDLKINEKV